MLLDQIPLVHKSPLSPSLAPPGCPLSLGPTAFLMQSAWQSSRFPFLLSYYAFLFPLSRAKLLRAWSKGEWRIEIEKWAALFHMGDSTLTIAAGRDLASAHLFRPPHRQSLEHLNPCSVVPLLAPRRCGG